MHSSCKHYRPLNTKAGHCMANVYGEGSVSAGTCLMACPVYQGNEDLRRAYRRRMALTVHGIDPDTMRPVVHVHRWLGIDWIGKPFPLRLRLRRSWPFVGVEDAPGCGCIMVLKRWWLKIRRRVVKKQGGCGCQS